jgi:hypothetical protein
VTPLLAGRCHPEPVSQSVDLPLPRRPLFFPVVIATVLLSIIGMSAGLVLGSRHEAPQQETSDQTGYVPTEPTISRVNCPPEMRATARRVLGHEVQLSQVLRVKAAATGTTVWICEDEASSLYYQANRGGYEKRWVEGETALFLERVVRQGDGYLATANDGNTFFVDEQHLTVVRKGEEKTYDVVPE